MEYKILKHKSMKSLTENVNVSIIDGWSPLGGLTLIEGRGDDETRFFCQAMVKSDA